jgi:lysophospholipase L1-like esterase
MALAKDSTIAKLTSKKYDVIEVRGHSWSTAAGVAGIASWFAMLAHSLGSALVNAGAAGSVAAGTNGWGLIIRTTSRQARGVDAKALNRLSVLMHGVNDAGNGVPTANFINAMRVIIRRLQALASFEQDDATVTTGGTWTTATNLFSSGGSIIKSTVTGSTVTIAVPSWWTGGVIALRSTHDAAATTPFAATNGGTYSVALDGAAQTAWVIGAAGNLTGTTFPDIYELAVPAGAHTILLTATAITSEIRFDAWDMLPTGNLIPVLVALPARPVDGAYTAYSATNPGITQAVLDANVQAYAAALVTLCASIGAKVFDMESVLGKDSLVFQSDFLHPNAAGQLGIARAALRVSGESAIRELDSPGLYGEDAHQNSTTRSSNGTTGIGIGGYGKARSVTAMINVTAMTGTTPSLEVIIEGRSMSDSATFFKVASVVITAAGAYLLPLPAGWPDTLRVRWVLTGTTPTATFSAVLAAQG